MKPIIYTSPFSLKHDTGDGHPESAARIVALEELFASPPFKDWPQKQSTKADIETVMLAHDEDYIFDLQDKTPDHGLFYLDGDTVLSSASFDAALYGAGAVCNAVDDVLNEVASHIFCATRPPGHHAEPNTALGFCLMNNVFIGAKYALDRYAAEHDIKNIAIIDFDVHHGNGTETMARRHNIAHPDTPISYISSHSYPLFPMTGDPAENDDYILNMRLPDKCGSETFRKLYKKQVFSHLNTLKPDLIFISAGFDAHIDDPLANIGLKTDDFAWITQKLCDISAQHSKNRIISVLEGGYNVPVLTDCVKTHLEVLAR